MSNRGLADFIAEATEILEALGSDLLMLEGQRGAEPRPEVLNAIFRSAHSLKGLAALFAQDRIASLAHGVEDVLDRLRLGKLELSDSTLDGLLDALDVLNALLASLTRGEQGEALNTRVGEVLRRLGHASADPGKGSGSDPLDRLELPPRIRAVFTEYEEHRLRENVRRGVPLFRVRAEFDLEDFDRRLAALNARIEPLGELISTLPGDLPGAASRIAFDLLVGARVEPEALAAGLSEEGVELTRFAVRPAAPGNEAQTSKPSAPAALAGSAPTQVPPAASAPVPDGTHIARRTPLTGSGTTTRPGTPPEGQRSVGAGRSTGPGITLLPEDEAGTTTLSDLAARQGEVSMRSLSRTVRVDIGRLDALMHLVGELMVSHSGVARLTEQLRGHAGIPAQWVHELTREGRRLERRLSSLQKGLLEARMVPLGQVFDRLSRLVRRAAREAGKELDFTVSGGEVELDKLIVEELSDPLMHIIRNAIDHGIESPEVRAAAGKSRRGRIHLQAVPRGNHVVLEVSDDGGGMDPLRIRDVAVERGVLTPAGAGDLSRRELLNLIFLPGFSTAEEVSTLSGRGVGLDVVKTNLAHLAGILDLWSELGEGTRFTLTLPVTLAILRALVVEASGRTYAVPLNSVIEILSPEDEMVARVEGAEVLTVRGQTVPLARLSTLLGHPPNDVPRPFAILVGIAQERLAILVDRHAGQLDIVTQPLPPALSGIPELAGATSLGERTVLVLDVAALVERALRPRGRREPELRGMSQRLH
ncbi:MAG TPA: chemotaxis protein CheA [Myxococcaceae bacterium]|nr:chemotaxis protein CheA [Myxococcaceae bacterium]